jgi:predicted  nucleic acid-binding Zn-ribbon protein
VQIEGEMTRLTDEEIDLELKSDSLTMRKRMALELKQHRHETNFTHDMYKSLQRERDELRADIATLQDQLRTLRENRFHASSLLDCKAENERLREALLMISRKTERVVRQALEKGNG